MQSTIACARFLASAAVSRLAGARVFNCLWELTYRCNARCRICAYWNRPGDARAEMTTDHICLGLRRVCEHGCRFVNFTGGEPTLRPDLDLIIEFASSLGMWTSLVTNGTLLTQARVRSLKAAGLDSLMLSVDSVDPEWHDRQRGVPGLHARVLTALQLVADEFMTGIRVGGMMCVLSRRNLDAAGEVVALADKLGVYVLFQPYHENKTGGRDLCAAIHAEDVDRIHRAGRRYGTILNSRRYLDGVAGHACGASPPRCLAGQKYFSVDPFGYVHPCVDMPAAGHVLSDPISVLQQGDAAAAIRSCPGCWYCFRGEADSLMARFGWVHPLALGMRIARRNAWRRLTRPHPAAPEVWPASGRR